MARTTNAGARATERYGTLSAPPRKRHLKPKHTKDSALASYSTELLRKCLHTESKQSRNWFRCYFRDDSDISSCTSLSDSDAGAEGNALLLIAVGVLLHGRAWRIFRRGSHLWRFCGLAYFDHSLIFGSSSSSWICLSQRATSHSLCPTCGDNHRRHHRRRLGAVFSAGNECSHGSIGFGRIPLAR